MRLDAVTQRHLELVETERTRERAGSLLGTLDRTVTPMGRRMLRGWLLRPLVDVRKIAVRQAIVAELVADAALRASARRSGSRPSPTWSGWPAARAPAGRPWTTCGRSARPPARCRPWRRRRPAVGVRSCGRSVGRGRPWPQFAERAAAALDARRPSPGTMARRRPAVPGRRPARLWPRRSGSWTDARRWQSTYVERLRRQPGLSRVKLEQNSTQGLFLEVPLNTRVPVRVDRGAAASRRSSGTRRRELDEHAQELSEAEVAGCRRDARPADRAARGRRRGRRGRPRSGAASGRRRRAAGAGAWSRPSAAGSSPRSTPAT